jgi:DNA modification methylase
MNKGAGTIAIVQRDVDSLIPYINNSRTHSPEQVAQIAASIKEFGWTNPILVDAEGVVIAGHGRLMAARKLGYTEVPTIELSEMTETQKKAYVIADNRLALNAGWDNEMLTIELNELLADGYALDILGFDAKELDALLEPEVIEGLVDEDEVPEVGPEPVTKPGDIWVLGKHRLMCGDSTMLSDVERLMNGATPDLVHTDPPYGMNAVSKSSVLKKNYKVDILGDDNPDVAKDAFNLIFGLYPESKHVWWGANYYCSVLPDSECWLVWDKNNGQSDQTDCELAWANFRSVVRQFTQASEKTNRVHPTQKPVSLVEWIFKRFNLSIKTVADFFGGSGSTLITAEKNGIQSFIMEFDPKFCDVIVKRWEDFTGKKAVLEEQDELADA